jgi:N-acetylmuramoyl-L-alanine amidase
MFRGLALLLLFAVSAQAVEVRDARVWAGPESTRVVLDLSGRAAHQFSVLKNPDRVVVDIRGAHLKKGRYATFAGAGSVKQIRLGIRSRGDLRVVVDLSRRVKAKSFLSPPNHRYGYRLVIDLTGADAVAPPQVARETPVKAEHAPPDARDLVIAVDAGHGGEDPGATGKNGTHEKNVVLAIARQLAQQIDNEPGMRAVLIRDGDYFVTLRDRMQRARKQQADLFVSVHADSIRDRAVTGSSVYILSQKGATDEASRWLAERENAADLVGGVSLENKDDVLASVLLDLSQTAALNASQAAANNVLHRLDQIGEIRKRQVQQARFVVLKSPDIPSMLVETAYISNPGEEQRLRDRAYQEKIAVAIHQGLKDYFYSNPPAGTRVAQLAAQRALTTRAVVAAAPMNGPGG